ncbi:MAG: hypothetical protein ACKVP7_09805, partial [Hyphomicrobiaceae bacterium]
KSGAEKDNANARRPPRAGAFLRSRLMDYCSGQPMQFCSGVDKRAERDDEAGASALAQLLGGLPLALEHAGAFCNSRRGGPTFGIYQRNLSQYLARAPRGSANESSVFTTLEMSISAAAPRLSSDIMDVLGFLGPTAAPINVLFDESLWPYLAETGPVDVTTSLTWAPQFRLDAVSALAELSLIRQQDDGDLALVDTHVLVQAAIRKRLEISNRLEQAGCFSSRLVLAAANALIARGFSEPWLVAREFMALLPHMVHVLEYAPRQGQDAFLITRDIGRILNIYLVGGKDWTFSEHKRELKLSSFGVKWLQATNRSEMWGRQTE